MSAKNPQSGYIPKEPDCQDQPAKKTIRDNFQESAGQILSQLDNKLAIFGESLKDRAGALAEKTGYSISYCRKILNRTHPLNANFIKRLYEIGAISQDVPRRDINVPKNGHGVPEMSQRDISETSWDIRDSHDMILVITMSSDGELSVSGDCELFKELMQGRG